MSYIKTNMTNLRILIEDLMSSPINPYSPLELSDYFTSAHLILKSYANAKNELGLAGTDKYFHYLAFYDCAQQGADRFTLNMGGITKELVDLLDFDSSTVPEFQDLGVNFDGANDGANGVDPKIKAKELMPRTTKNMLNLLKKNYSWVFEEEGFKDFYNTDPKIMPRSIMPRYNVVLTPEQRRYAWSKKGHAPGFVRNLNVIGID